MGAPVVVNHFSAGILDGIFTNGARNLNQAIKNFDPRLQLAVKISCIAFSILLGVAIGVVLALYTSLPVIWVPLIALASVPITFHFLCDWARAISILVAKQ